jgi:glucose/arabinose dehydrogenase
MVVVFARISPHDQAMTSTQVPTLARSFLVGAVALLVVVAGVAAAPASTTAGGAEDTNHADAGLPAAGLGQRAAAKPPLRRFAITWKRVASGFAQPTEVTSAPDGRNRLFVVQKTGDVRIVRDGRVAGRPYVSIGGRVDPSGEGGLLSLAFSPTFRRDGLLWVTYTARGDGALVVARMRAGNAGATRVRSKTLRTVLRVSHPTYDNHYGGQLAFGPGKRLFVGVCDGGGGGDPFNAAGDKTDLRGKILRIDPYGECRKKRYCSPAGNPFVSRRGRDEIWLMGLRNPWRFSFDKRTDNLWIGDVGQDAYEEISRVGPHPRRIHLGWSCREGRAVYNASRCRTSVSYLGPETVVGHPMAQSITGGFVYRGHRYRDQIGGAYVFADFITRRVWLYRPGPGKVLQADRLGSGIGASSFGVDDLGEIYAVTYDGVLWRLRVTRG